MFPEHIQEMRDSETELQKHALLLADHVFRLGEALGVERVIRPSGNPGESGPAAIDVETIIEKIEKRIGHKIVFHNPFDDEFGIATRFGLISYRSLLAIYQAWRLVRLGCRSVLEIGAGMGRTIVFARSFAVEDYAVIDVPMTLVGQACFIAATLGEDAVHLVADKGGATGRVRLLPPSRLGSLKQPFDVVLNVNSLTELDVEQARIYVQFVLAGSRRFISINHEENAFTVADLFSGKACDADRFPYWMRKGYVEEVFTPR